MFNFLIPKKTKIFDGLVEQSRIIQETAQLFREATHDWRKLKENSSKIEDLEMKADELVHAITDEIETAFILPLDKEDLKELTELLDDIEDDIEEVANRLIIYRISKPNQALQEFSDFILASVEKISQAIRLIKENKLTSKEFFTHYRSLHEIENKADQLHRKVLGQIMGNGSPASYGKDTRSALKWIEIFQTLEDTLDECEDVAIIFDRLRIKYK